MSFTSYTFTQTINDPYQLSYYLSTYVGPNFDHLTYNLGTITVYTIEAQFSSTTQSSITSYLAVYPDLPASTYGTFTKQTSSLDMRTTVDNTTIAINAFDQISVGLIPVSKGGTGITAIASGNIPFGNTSTALSVDSQFSYNSSTKILSVVSFVGSTLNLSGSLTGASGTFSGNLSVTGALSLSGALSIINTTASVSVGTGALIVSGGLSVAGSQYIGGSNFISGNSTVSGILTNTNTTNTSSGSTGALITAGGLGIAKNLFVAGTSTSGSMLITGSTQNVLTINAQGSTSNPAVIMFSNSGGTGDFRITGDGGDIYWQGGGSRALQMGSYHQIILSGGRNSTVSLPYSSGNSALYNTIIQNSNDSIGLSINAISTQTADFIQLKTNVGGILSRFDNLGRLFITDTTTSTISTTGALVVTGGTGIAGALNIGGIIKVENTTTSSSTTTGALVVNGGAAVAKSLTVGAGLSLVAPASVPATPASGTNIFYTDATTGTLRLLNSNGTPVPFSDSLKTKGDLLAGSGVTNATKIFGVGIAGTVLTANPSSEFGMSWTAIDINNTAGDPQTCKYAYFLKMSDQTISSTFTDILFGTESVCDRAQYIQSYDNRYVWIKNAGVYVFSAKVTGYFAGSFVTNTTCAWNLQIDQTCTDLNYSTISGATVFTTHQNISNNGSDSAQMAAIITVTGTSGAYVKIGGMVNSGTTTISAMANNFTCTLIYIPNMTYSDVYITSGTQALTTTYAGVPLSTVRASVSPFSYVSSSASVDVSITGYYIIFSRVNVQKTSGSDYTSCQMQLYDTSSGTVFAGTQSGTQSMVASSAGSLLGYTSMYCMTVVLITAGSGIHIRAKIATGSGVIVTHAGILAFYMPPASYPTQLLFNAYSVQTTQTLTSTYTLVPLNTIQTLLPTGSSTFTAGGSEVIVQNNGVYVIVGTISCYNPSNLARTIYGELYVSIDNGASYYAMLGSIGQRTMGKYTTIIVPCLHQFPAGARISLMVKSDGSASDNIVLADSTSLTCACLENISTVAVSSAVTYGTFYLYIDSTDIVTLASVGSWFEKIRLQTKYVPAGTYRISTNGTVNVTSSGNTLSVRMLLVDPLLRSFVIASDTISFFKSGQTSYSRDVNFTIPQGINTISLQFNPSGTGTTVNTFLLEIVRLF